MSLVADKIGRIFHDIFHIEIGKDDDFFDLGGDSLAGETLLAGIERDFGISLPLSILLEKSTPRSLADAVAAKMKAALPTMLFTVRDTGSSTPLFCIHGGNGAATFSRKLRDLLPDRPIYALRALGILPGEVPLVSAPEMARSYISEIRRVRPSGPYHLFGQCSTAMLAYEVAQQLSAAGEKVETVTLADPRQLKRRSLVHRFYYGMIGRRAIRTAQRFPQMSGDERRQAIIDPAMDAAMKTYEARAYSGKVLLVAASKYADEILHPKLGYPALIPHLDTHVLDGGHMDVFRGAVGKLASAMSSFMAGQD